MGPPVEGPWRPGHEPAGSEPMGPSAKAPGWAVPRASPNRAVRSAVHPTWGLGLGVGAARVRRRGLSRAGPAGSVAPGQRGQASSRGMAD